MDFAKIEIDYFDKDYSIHLHSDQNPHREFYYGTIGNGSKSPMCGLQCNFMDDAERYKKLLKLVQEFENKATEIINFLDSSQDGTC